MTETFKINDEESGNKTVNAQIAARQRALEEIDNAKFGWYHVRAIMVAGSGFFTDAYDIFSINMGMLFPYNLKLILIVSTLLGYVYYRNATDEGKMPSNLDEALKVGTSAGAIIGQVLFGFLCDKLGRKRVTPSNRGALLRFRCTVSH